eukprot:650759-Prorocentrum_minimum.AAC.1
MDRGRFIRLCRDCKFLNDNEDEPGCSTLTAEIIFNEVRNEPTLSCFALGEAARGVPHRLLRVLRRAEAPRQGGGYGAHAAGPEAAQGAPSSGLHADVKPF